MHACREDGSVRSGKGVREPIILCMFENFKGNSVKMFLGQLILSVRRMLWCVHYSLQPGPAQEWWSPECRQRREAGVGLSASGFHDHNAEDTCSLHFSQVWPPIVFDWTFCPEQEKGIVYQICQRISGEVERDRINKPKQNAGVSKALGDLDYM